MKRYKKANLSITSKLSILSIACSCVLPVYSGNHVAPIEVDGAHIDISGSTDTIDITSSTTQLQVKNNGLLTLTDVADAKLNSNATNAVNISVEGSGSLLTIAGGKLTTSGVTNNYAMLVKDGAQLNISNATVDDSSNTNSGFLGVNISNSTLASVTVYITDSQFAVGKVGFDFNGSFTAYMAGTTVTSDVFGKLINVGHGDFTGDNITLINNFAGTSAKNSTNALITSAGIDEIANVYSSRLESKGVQLVRASPSSEFTFGNTVMSWKKGAGANTNDTAVAAWAWDSTGLVTPPPVHDYTRLTFADGTQLKVDGNGSQAYGVSVNHLTTFSMDNSHIEMTNTGSDVGAAIFMAGEASVEISNGSTITTNKESNAIYLSDEQDIASSWGYANSVAAGAGDKTVTINSSQLTSDSSAIRSQANDNSVGYNREIDIDNSTITGARDVSNIVGNAWQDTYDKVAIEHQGTGSGIADEVLTVNNMGTTINGGLLARGNSARLDFNSDGSYLNGSVYADAGVANITLDGGSLWTGGSHRVNNGTINANLNNGGIWNVTKSSNLTNLAVNSSSMVIMGNWQPLSAANKVTLTTDTLQGQGQGLGMFIIRTNMANYVGSSSRPYGDLLVINKKSSGDYGIVFDDSSAGSAKVNGYERLMVVQYKGTNQADNQATFTGNDVDVGPYTYEFNQAKDGNWYLGRGGAPKLSNPADVSVNLLNTSYLINHVENETLLQRMGELRNNANNAGDFWIRSYGGKINKFSSSRLSSLHLNYAGMQIGVDRKIELANGNDLYIGLMGGYTKGDTDYKVGGGGDTKSYHGGLYATYKTKDDWYVDSIVKYVHMKNNINTYTSGGHSVEGDASSKGFSVGLEGGKRFYLGAKATAKEGWYLEPQAQVTYSYQGGSTVHSSNGLKTDLDNYDSVLARGSVIAGYSIKQGDNPVDVYVKTGYLREFNGNTRYTFNSHNKENYSFKGGWWDNGVGVNMQLQKNHNIYLDGTFAKGGKFDRKQINLGYRYSF